MMMTFEDYSIIKKILIDNNEIEILKEINNNNKINNYSSDIGDIKIIGLELNDDYNKIIEHNIIHEIKEKLIKNEDVEDLKDIYKLFFCKKKEVN